MKIYRAGEFNVKEFCLKRSRALPEVAHIIEEVRRHGDSAVKAFSRRFDGCAPGKVRVSRDDLRKAHSLFPRQTAAHLDEAEANVRLFSERQREAYKDFDLMIGPGVTAGQRVVPLDAVGIYVPGGRFPLLSSLVMAAVPAQTAGVRRIAVCSPPTENGLPHPFIMAAADRLGIGEIYAAGGAQAVAAMAYGTESMPRVDKIVGPGNRFVNAAKKAVYGAVGIDFIAGPTEILIIADESARPGFVALDLIAQAEHDPDVASILISDSMKLIQDTAAETNLLLRNESDFAAAVPALEINGAMILTKTLDEAVCMSDEIAPEHLIINTRNPELWAGKVRNYGSLFLGPWASEVLGDYSSGLNHILPTNGAARYTGGLNVGGFLKVQTLLSVTEEGMRTIGPTAEALADIEGLLGHRSAVRARLRAVEEEAHFL